MTSPGDHFLTTRWTQVLAAQGASTHAGAALATALRQRAVIVRHFSAPRISDHLRISVGTDGQTDRLLSALSDILGSA